jgi:hypothetical protein
MTADYRVLLAGQDITSTVQFHSDQNTNLHSRINATTSPASGGGGATPQPLLITSTLGQGAGSSAGHSGRTAQATFFTTLGPAATAVGAGSVITFPRLVRQGEVQVLDPNGVVLFGGYAGKLSDATVAKQVYTKVECYDYWQSLTRININEVLDGISDVAAITYLLTTYAPWVDQRLIPAFASGTLLGRVWRNKTLQWALKTIADQTGRQISITPTKQLLYVSPTQAQPAPFALSDTPDFSATFPHALDEFTIDDTSLINRVTFYGGKKPTPDFAQDISTQANGSNAVFMLAYYPRKSSTGKVQVLVNGTQLTVGYVLSTGAANTLTSQGGTAECLIDADARTITFATPPATGATVICIYRYQTPLVVEVTDQNSYAFYGNWYDGTISDETVVDSATAVQRCRVILLEQSYGQSTLKVRCYRGGLQAGQQLTLTNTLRGIAGTYIIQEVQSAPVAVGVFEYAVTLGAWNWNLVDVLLRLAQASANQDLAQQENVTPTQVKVSNTITAKLAVVVKPLTRPMAAYSPGVTTVVSQTVARKTPFTLPSITGTTTGSMYPGLFSI